LCDNKILTEEHNGFRLREIIETVVQAFIEIIQEALDKGAHIIGIQQSV
jgi:nucleoid DNA-binding protein